MHPLATAVLYSLAPLATAATGTLIVFVRLPNAPMRSAIQHFAAGVVFSVVAVELLPDIRKRHNLTEVVLGFVIGIAVMLVLHALTSRLERNQHGQEAGLPMPLIAATGIDVVVDGFLIGIGLRAGQKQGLLLTLALSTEFLSLGVAIALELLQRNFSRWKTFNLAVGTCAFVVVGAFLGTTVLSHVSSAIVQIILSGGLAALLFLVTEELLVEAHEVNETPWITASFFLGFVLFLMLGMTENS